MRYFKNIKNIYPKFDKFGNNIILRKKTERNDQDENFNLTFELSYSGLVEDISYEENKEYVVLLKTEGDYIISNSNDILKMYKPYLDELNGDILIFGLGLGILILPLLEDSTINNIDVIELDVDMINYVYTNRISGLDTFNKLNVINDNAFTYNTNNMYDYILIDIWSDINSTVINDANTLKDKFTQNLNQNGKIGIPILGL